MFQHHRPFPKSRDPLPPAYQKIYSEWMAKNRTGQTRTTSISTRLEQWMHRRVADDLAGYPEATRLRTLELGSGTGNHLQFDHRSAEYDVVEPMDVLFEKSPQNRIQNRFKDLGEVPLGNKYDRIISIAVLEHLENLPLVLNQASKLLVSGGSFRAGIPSEGGWLWRQAWRNTTARTFAGLYELDYEMLMAYEHLNSAQEIKHEIEKAFGKIKVKYFGLGDQFSFYQFVEATKS